MKYPLQNPCALLMISWNEDGEGSLKFNTPKKNNYVNIHFW